jgi:hypothetical protein
MKIDVLRSLLRQPKMARELTLAEWDILVRQARSADLLGRVAVLLDEFNLLGVVPPAPRLHFDSALVLAAAQARAVRREVEHIADALAPLGDRVVLLKGAAYLLANLPAARGRMFSDTDILVPHARLPAVEAALMLNGWTCGHPHPYDQRYYREWMHELPPMQHIQRMTVIDVHHAIVPITARLKPDSLAILNAAVPIEEFPGIFTLAPTDMVLHSATHLFYNEEFSHGMRDLSDLDLLLRHFGESPVFWNDLVERSRCLTLDRPLYYCVRHSMRMFGTPVPFSVLEATAPAAPVRWGARLMDGLWWVALRPPHPSLAGPLDPLAGALLYFRAHWERMPLLLLTYHILHKAFRREPEIDEKSASV